MTRPHRAALAALFLALPALPVVADPRVIGPTDKHVRILKPGSSPEPRKVVADSAPQTTDFGLAPAAPPADAMDLARRFVAAYGGPAALRAWIGSGSREGHDMIFVPARVRMMYLERRSGERARIDAHSAGIDVVLVDSPDGGW